MRHMDLSIARSRYNAAGYHPMIDYRCEESRFAIERIEGKLRENIADGTRVLDLGCNAGRYCFATEEMGAVATGIDCSEAALSIAREIALDTDSRCSFVHGDMRYLPFGENTFDVALLPRNILEMSYDDVDMLCAELCSVLVTGGRLCVEMDDGLRRLLDRGVDLSEYDITTGQSVSIHTIPDKGDYEYHTWFWTVAFAKHVIGRHLMLVEEHRYRPNSYWLVFENAPLIP